MGKATDAGSTSPQVGAGSRDEFMEFRNPADPTLDRLVQAVDRAYNRPWLMLWRSFLQGMMSAIGAVVGTALVVALAGFVFNRLGGLELLRPGVQKLQDMIFPQELRDIVPDVSSQSLLTVPDPSPTVPPALN
jgi:hypothetical protein